MHKNVEALKGLTEDLISRERTEKRAWTNDIAKAVYEDLYENNPIYIFSVEPFTAKILYCSQSFASSLGYTKGELIGQSIFKLYDDVSRNKVKNKYLPKLMKQGKLANVYVVVVKKDGSKMRALMNCTLKIDSTGLPVATRCAWTPINGDT